MALDSKNNIKSVFIVPDLAAVAANTKITPGSTPTGSVSVTSIGNVVLDTTTVLTESTIKIVKDRGANLPLQQVRLNLNDIIAYSGTPGAAATEQVSFVGSNGTTGSINVIPSNFYIIKLEHIPNAFLYGKRPANYKYGTFQSTASPTEEDIANGLVKSLVQNFKPNRTIDWRVFSEVTNAGARTAAGTGPGTLTFTKYSKTVVASATTATDALFVGDYISIASGVTNGVYKITAIDGTTGNLTLAIAYNGETVSGIAGTGSIAITAAAAAGANFGIKITGIKQKYDVNRWRQYDKVRFNTLVENFGATTVTTTAATDGIGVYEQAANDEYISWGDEGQVFVDQVPPLFREQDAVVGTQYNPLIVGWVNKLPSLIGAGENKGSAILYIVDGTTQQGEEVALVLDAWTALKGFANQQPNL